MSANEITTHGMATNLSPTNLSPTNGTPAPQPIRVVVSAWDRYRVTPGGKHYLGVTITSRGEQDVVVQVRLDSSSALLAQWCARPEQWLALTPDSSGELIFTVEVPGDALPQWLDYDVVVRPQGLYANYYLPPSHHRLQILAPETTETSQDPSFSLSPITSPDQPVLVQPGLPIPVELLVENRSERVDRFRLECTGLPPDWGIQIDYPSEQKSLGLVRIEDSLGVNPGDRSSIHVCLHPPALPLAGSYLPTFRLASENDPTLGLLGLVYLRVAPVYLMQAQLQAIQEQVRDRPAQFSLQFANLGNTPRQVQVNLKSLVPSEECLYTLPADTVTVPPQTTTQVPLTGQPQRRWARPWFGFGKRYPFQVEAIDPVDRQPISPDSFQGYLTWMPRPWWQLLLAALAGLGLLGTLIFLIWWCFFRPPAPVKVLEFATEDGRYAEVNGDMARVRWQIEHPERIQTLKLTGYSPEGEVLSGPLVYEFKNGELPASLKPFCTVQTAVLTCSQIRSDAFQPGKYIFELTLMPNGRGATAIALKTSPVEIAAKPLPTVTDLLPRALVYREATPGTPSPAEKAVPVVDAAGVRLDWAVTMPKDIAALHLVGRDAAGKMVGDVWFEFTVPGQVPDILRPFCRLEKTLVCRNVPTGLTAVGDFRFELSALRPGQPESAAVKPKVSEVVKIQPQMPQILSFKINGQEAPAKLLLPVQKGQPLPLIQVGWQVQGGATTQVELMPAPGTVPLVGQMGFPLSPQGGTTISLQVKTPTGAVLTRSVTLEVYDPNPTDAAAIAAAAVKAAIAKPAPGAPGASGADAPAPLSSPAATTGDRLSPAEQPPQFNQRP
jgi:hypothetical protein